MNAKGSSGPGQPARRRRRPRIAPVDHIAAESVNQHRAGTHPAEPRGHQTTWRNRLRRLKHDLLPAFGLSPRFRAYLFAGSILAILSFLLFSESVIRQLRDREKSNVDLYAKLISLAPLAADQQSITIFEEISINPSINFPIIVTDYTGRIIHWNNVDLAAPETGERSGLSRWRSLAFWRQSAAAGASDSSAGVDRRLRQLVREMDAKNEPIPFYPVPEVSGRVFTIGGNLIITDRYDWPVKWYGPDLPAAHDTTAAARETVERFLDTGPHVAPLVFKTPVGVPGYVYFDSRNLVVVDRKNDVLAWRGPDLPPATDTTEVAVQEVSRRLMAIGAHTRPLTFDIPAENFIHYGDSRLVQRMALATYVQITALMLFLLVAYVGFRNIRRSEQRSIWVGMAKETAHQLGTPLSSLSGWLELFDTRLREIAGADESAPHDLADVQHMVQEMRRDMERLAKIASRFSQIGSQPELEMGDVVTILHDITAYFRTRGPQFGQHQIDCRVHGTIPPIPLNPELIGWVFENLFKNSVDALQGEPGAITIDVSTQTELGMVQLIFADSGRGIAHDHIDRIFDPGFSTKKRGWGLGLAFARRIVEDYHGGRISLVSSDPGQGTRFEVMLPLAGGDQVPLYRGTQPVVTGL